MSNNERLSKYLGDMTIASIYLQHEIMRNDRFVSHRMNVKWIMADSTIISKN